MQFLCLTSVMGMVHELLRSLINAQIRWRCIGRIKVRVALCLFSGVGQDLRLSGSWGKRRGFKRGCLIGGSMSGGFPLSF